MAKAKESLGSVKRFEARYGRTVKFKFGEVEKEQRKLHKCPYCNYTRVKRESVGIWNCKKCGARFAAKAYTIQKKIVKEQQGEEESVEQEKEEDSAEEGETEE